MNTFGQLISQLDDSGATKKIAAKFGGYIRDRLRETSFAEQVLPPENIQASQCQVSTQHDSLVKIENIEPRSRAMTVTFRGEPRANFIRGERVEIPFITIMSDMFQKPEQELLAYTYPIARVIEDNSIKDMGEIIDREFCIHIESAVQALQTEFNGGTPTALNAATILAGSVVEASVCKGELARNASNLNGIALPIQKPDFVRVFKLLDGNRLESDLLLLTTVDYDDMLQWTVEDQGDKIQSETLVKGYQYNTILGKRYVRTIKTDILRPGNVYCFTSPDFLGKYYVLNNTKFFIDKYINMIKFCAWKDVGMSIINIAAVRKLELYSGDACPVTNADGILSSVIPVGEEDLGRQNNRAGNRQFYPQVVSIG